MRLPSGPTSSLECTRKLQVLTRCASLITLGISSSTILYIMLVMKVCKEAPSKFEGSSML